MNVMFFVSVAAVTILALLVLAAVDIALDLLIHVKDKLVELFGRNRKEKR